MPKQPNWQEVVNGLYQEVDNINKNTPPEHPDFKMRNSEARILLCIAASLQRGIALG